MKNRAQFGCCLFLAGVICGIGLGASAFGQSANPGVAWQKYFGDAANWYESTAVAASPKGELLVALRARTPFTERYANPHIWTFNQNGERVSDIEIKNFLLDRNEIKTEGLTVLGLSAEESGDISVVLTDNITRQLLMKLTGSGQVLVAKVIDLKANGPRLRISKIVWAGDHIFLVGHRSFNAYVARVEVTGTVAWEKEVDRGRMELFSDGIATDDGGVLLVGNMGQYDMFRVGPSEAWLSRYSATGAEVRQPGFIGRYGRFARSSDGNYWLVYDKSNTSAQEIWVKVLTPDLKQVSTSKVLATKLGFADFKIASLAAGGCVVMGEENEKPFLAKLDASGSLAGSFTEAAGISAARFDLVGVSDSFFAVSAPYIEDQQHKSTEKLDIAKLVVK